MSPEAGVKCDYCDKPAVAVAGETNGLLVCGDHVKRRAGKVGELTADEVGRLLSAVFHALGTHALSGHTAELERRLADAGNSILAERECPHPVACRQAVVPLGCEWVATCDHGEEVWTVHRGTEHNAWRSLRAHARAEHP